MTILEKSDPKETPNRLQFFREVWQINLRQVSQFPVNRYTVAPGYGNSNLTRFCMLLNCFLALCVAGTKRSISRDTAVLLFTNISNDMEQEYSADGITED